MNEPADKEDVKTLVTKLDQLGTSVENMRAQNSAEHGSLFTKMLNITNVVNWLKTAWLKFQILPPPPPEPPKDDTQ